MRIAFGLSNTLADIEESGFDFTFKLRPGAFDLVQILKQQGHVLILWTSKKRSSFSSIKRKSEDFFNLFDETYCKEDFELMQEIPGCSYHMFKDINRINADCLIESKDSYKKYAKILNLTDKYLIIDKYREFLLNKPAQWQIKMVGPGIVEKREKRRQQKEDWVIDVFEYAEKLNKDLSSANLVIDSLCDKAT